MKILIAVSNGEKKRNRTDFSIDITGLEKEEVEERLLEIVDDIFELTESVMEGNDEDY